jgi:hypothetical protein
MNSSTDTPPFTNIIPHKLYSYTKKNNLDIGMPSWKPRGK